jgi:hypothetical protein
MNGSSVRSSKMKLALILVVGSVTLFLLFILSLDVGQEEEMSDHRFERLTQLSTKRAAKR